MSSQVSDFERDQWLQPGAAASPLRIAAGMLAIGLLATGAG
jgi:hypothetical protein